MKRIASVLLLLVIVISAFSTIGLIAFAEEGAADGENVDSGAHQGGEETSNPSDLIMGFLGSFLPSEELKELYDTFVGAVKEIWDFIMQDETYQNIATAVLGVIAFLLIPVIVGVLVLVYVAISAMTLFAGALVGIIEMLAGVLFPMLTI